MAASLRLVLICLFSILLVGCFGPSGKPDGIKGAWLGEGTFRARMGSQDMKAQLEILPDGSYRLLILEPAMLAMVGVERGTWTHVGNDLDLEPVSEPAGSDEGFSLFGSAPRDFRPKTLTVSEDLRELTLDDGPMRLTFRPNREATKALRESGEL